jgi:cupin fold WbuC family metalloprotein
MQQVIEETPEVYYASASVATVGDDDIAFLKARAAANPRRRCRLCLHPAPSAVQHEMIIVHHRDAYVRPHRHERKSESLIVIEGEALAFTFDDAGAIASTIRLGAPGNGERFSYFMPAGTWHGLAILSEWLVFAEAAAGPFDAGATSFPAWAPDGNDVAQAAAYVRGLAGGAIAG